MSFIPDPAWLHDPARVWPVTIDPVITSSLNVNDITDTFADTVNYGDTPYNGQFLRVTGSGRIRRSYLRFTLPTLEAGDIVVSAKLCLVPYGNSGKQTVSVHRVSQDWASQTLNWNTKPQFEEAALDYYSYTGNNPDSGGNPREKGDRMVQRGRGGACLHLFGYQAVQQPDRERIPECRHRARGPGDADPEAPL